MFFSPEISKLLLSISPHHLANFKDLKYIYVVSVSNMEATAVKSLFSESSEQYLPQKLWMRITTYLLPIIF